MPFSRAPGIGRTRLTAGYSRFRLVPAITALPRLMRLTKARALVGLSRSVRHRALRRRVAYLRGAGILTGFPSASSVRAGLRTDLLPADDASPGNPGP